MYVYEVATIYEFSAYSPFVSFRRYKKENYYRDVLNICAHLYMYLCMCDKPTC